MVCIKLCQSIIRAIYDFFETDLWNNTECEHYRSIDRYRVILDIELERTKDHKSHCTAKPNIDINVPERRFR